MGLPGFNFLGFPEDEQEIISPKTMSRIIKMNRIVYFRAK